MNWKPISRAALTIVAAAVVLFGVSSALAPVAERNAQADREELMTVLLPGSTSFVEEEYTGEDACIRAVYKADNGYVVCTAASGYASEVVLLVGVNNDGAVTGLTVQEQSETFGLGAGARTDWGFLMQFLGTSGEAAVGEDIDALTGATVTSKAVTKAVNAAAAFVTGADVSSSATEWGDW